MTVLSGLNCIPPPGTRAGRRSCRASTRFLTDVSPNHAERRRNTTPAFRWIRSLRRRWASTPSSRRSSWPSSRAKSAGACDAGFRVRLHQHDLLAEREHAAADAEQPARGVRAAVRRQRQHRSEGAARAHPAGSQRSRLGQRGSRAPAGRRSGRAIAPSSPSISTRSATSSGASRRPRSRATRSCRSSSIPPAFPATYEEHVKLMFDLAGAGVSVRSDARHHVHAGPRVQRHDVSADRRARRAPPDLAPPERGGEDREGRQDQRCTT